MSAVAKRLLIDAIFAAIFARFSGVVRWVFFAVGGIFVFGMLSNAVSDLRAHGIGEEIDLGQIEVRTQVDDRLSQVYWDVTNRSNRVIGDVQITCFANGNERVIAPVQYIQVGGSASGVYYDSSIGYDTSCNLTAAKSYRK